MANLAVVSKKTQPLKNGNFLKVEFKGEDLHGKDMSHSRFIGCNFDDANMSGVNCEGCDFTNSTFRGTNLYRANWKDCKLNGIVFEPKDAYGITFSFSCETFRNVQIGQLWLYSWLVLATDMYPTAGPVKEDIREKIMAVIGAERYVKLKHLFARREF